MNVRFDFHPIWPGAWALTAALVLAVAQPAAAQPGWVLSHQKISDTQGGFTGTLDDGDRFGDSVALLGDHNGDGVGDLAVGAAGAGLLRGAVWVLFLDGICLWDLDANGSVGAADLLTLLASWGPCKGCPADFDGNDDVGVSDLLILLANWGPCP